MTNFVVPSKNYLFNIPEDFSQVKRFFEKNYFFVFFANLSHKCITNIPNRKSKVNTFFNFFITLLFFNNICTYILINDYFLFLIFDIVNRILHSDDYRNIQRDFGSQL